jgi:hypothetical protein
MKNGVQKAIDWLKDKKGKLKKKAAREKDEQERLYQESMKEQERLAVEAAAKKAEQKRLDAEAAAKKAAEEKSKEPPLTAEEKKAQSAEKRAAAKKMLEQIKLQEQREEQEIKAAQENKTIILELDNIETEADNLTKELDLCFDCNGNIKVPTDKIPKELDLRVREFEQKVQNAILSLVKIAFDSTVPGGEKLRILLGSSLGFSDQLTKEEFLKNLAMLPVDIVVDAFIMPKVTQGLIRGIKNIGNIKNLSKILKESKTFREAAQKFVNETNKAGTILSKEVKACSSVTNTAEIILPKLKTFEQARNEALNLVGDLGPGATAYYGRLQNSKGFGQVIGRISSDKKIRWYLDYDPVKGLHINVHDFRLGKGQNAKKYAIPFDGTEETFEALLKHLNR